MFGSAPTVTPQRIGFLLLPRFSLLAFAAAVEPLRMANTMAGRRLYDWTRISADGKPVVTSSRMQMEVDTGLAAAPKLPAVVVAASYEPERGATRAVLAYLRRAATFGTALGSLDTGSLVLAKAGLLNGYQATVHWEVLERFAERFPDITALQDIFVVDRDRFTSAGGTAGLDMMLNLIRTQHGHDLAAAVADEFIYSRIRDSRAGQRMPVRHRLATHNPRLVRVVELMEETLGAPLRGPELAAHAGVSERELARMFRRWLKTSPAAFYRRLRLERARALLQQTDMPIIEVAVNCGFASAAHFSRAYKVRFGRPPRAERGLEA